MSASREAPAEGALLPPNLRILVPPPDGHSGFPLGDAALSALSEAEERHFWHLARNEFIVERLAAAGIPPPARVLELGCGGGAVVACLSGAGYDVTGVDGSVQRLRQAASRAPGATFFAHDLARGLPREVGDAFDAVGLFDVLEHLDDPLGAIHGAAAAARVGGLIVGTVPAEMALWSAVDEAAGHRVRYTARTLTALLARVPATRVAEVLPFNRAIYPLLWVQRRLLSRSRAPLTESLRVLPTPFNALLAGLLRAERTGRLPGVRRMPGTSIWFALRKESGASSAS